MKYLLNLLLLLMFSAKAQTYPSYNISLLANIAPETLANWYTADTKYAGCYGWHNPVDNREYAILGSTTGNYFIEVTNPTAPVVRDFVLGTNQNNLWREIKTYQNYVYLVSDDNGSSLQIVDMRYLPDSVHVVYDSITLFTRSHTIFIDGNKLYCGSVTLSNAAFYSMAVYDLSNPIHPVLLRTLNQDYPAVGPVHDMFVKNDTVYASVGNSGLHIYKYNSNNTFTLLSTYTNYLQAGYNHSSYLSPDSRTLVFTDEVPAGLSAKVLDVSNFSNLTLTDTIVSHAGATAHNPYITTNYHAVISYYQDGVYIYDISNPNNAVLIGFFDTDTLHGNNDGYMFFTPYRGCWGTYPFLPSGILLASDMQKGLFILNMDSAMGVKKTTNLVPNYITIFPNPASNELNILISSEKTGMFELELVDIMGRVLLKSTLIKTETILNYSINTLPLASASYIIKLKGEGTLLTKKWVKSN